MTPGELAELDDDTFKAFIRHMEREAAEIKRAQQQRR
jgi:hypothetical protein